MGGLYKLYPNKYYDRTMICEAASRHSRDVFRGKAWTPDLIDGMVNGVGKRARGIGNILRLLQSGNIRSYAAWVVLGSVHRTDCYRIRGGLAMTLLDLVIFLPLVAFLIILALPKDNPAVIRRFAW